MTWLVIATEKLQFKMEVEAKSKAEALRKMEEYCKDGTYGWDSAGISMKAIKVQGGTIGHDNDMGQT